MKLTDKIHLLRIDFEIHINQTTKIPRFVNVVIIFGDYITLIDTGVKGSETVVFDYIEKQGRQISEIETIILSHSHPDHIGAAAKIREVTKCKVIAHSLEQEWIENIEEQNKQRPVPGFFNLVDTPVIPDVLIADNFKEIRLQENLTLELTKSSGHSKGMLNILFVEDKILFTADSIPLKNDIPNYDNYIELIDSLKRIKNNTQYEILLTSWTPPLTNKNEIDKIIAEGEEYMLHINSIVRKHYEGNSSASLDSCKLVVEELGLPPYLINPIVDKALKSHINE